MVHYFGDSYTEGAGIIKPSDRLLGPRVDLISPDISAFLLENSLTKLLKDDSHNNYAVGGSSNEDIINCIYSNINNFDTHDHVIIGTTYPGRKTFFFEDEESLDDVLRLQMLPTHYGEVENYLKSTGNNYFDTFNRDTLKSVNSYYREYLMQDKVIQYEYNTQKKCIGELQKFLLRWNIKSIVWEHGMWGWFETLGVWSNGDIDDGHFSPNGHVQLAHILYQAIEDGKGHLTKRFLDININRIRESLDYIPYDKEYSRGKAMENHIDNLPKKSKPVPFMINSPTNPII